MADARHFAFLDVGDPHWMELVVAAPGANAFHHPAWLQVLAECYGYRPFVVAIQDAQNRVLAGLPMMEVKSGLTGRRWVSLPFTDHVTPLGGDGESLRLLRQALLTLARDGECPRIELRSGAFQALGSPVAQYALHTLPLSTDVTRLVQGFHHTHRYDIALARKKDVRLVLGDRLADVDAFYNLHVGTRRRHGVPVQPKRYFELLQERLLEKGLGFVLRAMYQGECIAAAVLLRWQHTLTYKYSASESRKWAVCPNQLIVDAAIRWGGEHGYAEFDLGRSELDNAGLREFKSRWGATEQPLSYSTLARQHASLSDNGKLARALQFVIQGTPPWVCRTAGELLYRHFG